MSLAYLTAKDIGRGIGSAGSAVDKYGLGGAVQQEFDKGWGPRGFGFPSAEANMASRASAERARLQVHLEERRAKMREAHARDAGEAPSGTRIRTETNWKGESVSIPEGHQMSPLDPPFSAPPDFKPGPFTDAQRRAFRRGGAAGTKLEAHHRHQIPVEYGGVIDELKGLEHPEGNEHTISGRHPNESIFNRYPDIPSWRRWETKAYWKEKGRRLVKIGPDKWYDPGPTLNTGGQ